MVGISNAQIIGIFIGKESHGIMTIGLTLDYGGAQQSFGGYDLRGTRLYEWVDKLLTIFEIDDIMKLKGMYCRADSTIGKVNRIGALLKDNWFDPNTI